MYSRFGLAYRVCVPVVAIHCRTAAAVAARSRMMTTDAVQRKLTPLTIKLVTAQDQVKIADFRKHDDLTTLTESYLDNSESRVVTSERVVVETPKSEIAGFGRCLISQQNNRDLHKLLGYNPSFEIQNRFVFVSEIAVLPQFRDSLGCLKHLQHFYLKRALTLKSDIVFEPLNFTMKSTLERVCEKAAKVKFQPMSTVMHGGFYGRGEVTRDFLVLSHENIKSLLTSRYFRDF